ncbi:L,D-transpeptidase family protein [Paenibacillus aceris]|uniref:Lipoprotein-anchoring transpeptidase ErfK/SrfK n=1 Tax=Paenibacillus aceris TaxID=869555 RepID=A0ABS4HXP0_9BACL|nr:L,D-transpeptidase [Paenibacillus aceris]MBP1963437.1 lipoprotein-anchoring transpeptidase ErfK/SrfK [Paenibacillus aceris]NHW36706.1 L,D-transpeptidase [Paenibacillus aceris]
MKNKNHHDQLERFFQHNPIEDPQYLKKYVKEHPDHKMAWYLLGREYAAQGKEGKAAYCFAQSGEIYEAFERQKITIEGPLPSYPTVTLKDLSEPASKSRMKGAGKWMPLLVILLLLAVPAAIDSANQKVSDGVGKARPYASSTPTVQTPVKQEGPAGTKLYFSEGDWGEKLQQVLTSSGSGTGESVIMQAPRSADGKWTEWNKSVNPLLGVTTEGGGSSAALKYYQSQICSCQAADSSALVPVIDQWMRERERAIVLQSAMEAYQQKTGSMPEKPDQLARPYPDNLLPGLTAEMQELFPQALSTLKAEIAKADQSQQGTKQFEEIAQSQQEGKENAVPSSSQPMASTDPLREPLRIVIDTEKHLLALISGDMIIRSYPVGLGGEKTPLGDFIISEKVRNPNGKSNGEFGSRGMTLSDTLYAIHGTNKPSSIGKDESHGCVRMQQADIEELYNMVTHQTKVTIGKGILPQSGPDGGDLGSGAGRGMPEQSFVLPLQTNDSNPGKKYKWLD